MEPRDKRQNPEPKPRATSRSRSRRRRSQSSAIICQSTDHPPGHSALSQPAQPKKKEGGCRRAAITHPHPFLIPRCLAVLPPAPSLPLPSAAVLYAALTRSLDAPHTSLPSPALTCRACRACPPHTPPYPPHPLPPLRSSHHHPSSILCLPHTLSYSSLQRTSLNRLPTT